MADTTKEESKVRGLEDEIARLKEENAELKKQKLNNVGVDAPRASEAENVRTEHEKEHRQSLYPHEIERYSRQLLLAQGFGVSGQLKLLSSSVLVVGAGGIGSTVLMYLAALGVGCISVLDFDSVEISNLHRQVIHKQNNVGMNKAVSACRFIKDLNPSIVCKPLPIMLTHENATDIVGGHNCVIDASDNPHTRYLINDTCVINGKPLISGSAIGIEGQLSVYNWKGGPCYRCLYPKPSISSGAKSCSENGVLGPVPGLIGVLQSLEALKVLTDTGSSMNDRLLVYDSLQCSFLNIKKRKKEPKCPLCSGPNATIKTMKDSEEDLRKARGPASCDIYTPLPIDDDLQISSLDYDSIRKEGKPHLLLDVRAREQYHLCALENAVSIPLESLQDNFEHLGTLTNGWSKPVYCMCRRGILSAEATKMLNDYINAHEKNAKIQAKNIKGGLEAWRNLVDKNFPKY